MRPKDSETQATRQKAYEGSALQALMKAAGHEICERCWCCDVVSESATCWQCNGFEDYDDQEWMYECACSVCDGEGKIYWKECIGRCDEQGNHKHTDDRGGTHPTEVSTETK